MAGDFGASAAMAVTCDECRDRLQDLVDGELSAAEKAALDAHIGGCAECAEMHRRLAKFTTTMVKAAQPLRPGSDFSSKVMQRFEESKAELERVPPSAAGLPQATRSYPVWPFAAGIAALVLISILFLFRGGEPSLGKITRNPQAAQVLKYVNGGWIEQTGDPTIRSGNRILATQSAGTPVGFGFEGGRGLRVFLRSPSAVHLELRLGQIVLIPMDEAPGRIRLVTDGAPGAPEQVVRVSLRKAWVEVKLADRNEVDVTPEGGNLLVSVKHGSARIGNHTETQPVAEGYTRAVPQEGECTPAEQAKTDAFAWLDEK